VFNFIVSGIQAYNQVGMFIGAVICLGFGGLLLGSSLYWRVHAIRASGTIVGVLKEGTAYYPVYRYRLPDGQFHEAKSDTGSGSLRGMETGRAVRLMISAHKPDEARENGDYLIDIIGIAFVAPGVWLGYTALTAYPITPMTWLMGIAFLVYAGERLRRVMTPKGPRVSIEEWKRLHNIGDAGAIDLTNVKPMESFPAQAAPAQKFQNSKAAGPLLAFFAIVLVTAGAYQSVRVFRFETSGLRADGEVVRLIEQSSSGSSGGYVYYPVVRFRTAENVTIEFKDDIGSNPPGRRPGDRAAVLYLSTNPAQAMIDRGIFNVLLPGLLFAGAGLLAWLMVWLRRARKAEAAQETGMQAPVPVANS
jgi:hypothetical protein